MLKALKSLFIIEEEDSKSKSTSKTKSKQAPKAKPATNTVSSIKESTKGRAGKVDSKFMNVLLKAMDNNNLEGFDYLEFKQSLKSLEKMPMDEATRYQSAFAMAKTMGASAAQLEHHEKWDLNHISHTIACYRPQCKHLNRISNHSYCNLFSICP